VPKLPEEWTPSSRYKPLRNTSLPTFEPAPTVSDGVGDTDAVMDVDRVTDGVTDIDGLTLADGVVLCDGVLDGDGSSVVSYTLPDIIDTVFAPNKVYATARTVTIAPVASEFVSEIEYGIIVTVDSSVDVNDVSK
jgi:hypothetical protein